MIRKILLLFLVFLTTKVYSQQDVNYSLYVFGKIFYNPAYTTNEARNISFNLLNKNQWTNFVDVYNAQGFSINGTISQNRIGLGAICIRENYSTYTTTFIQIPVSYKLNIKNGFLNFGLEPSIKLISAHNYSNVRIKDDDDHVLQTPNSTSPNLSIGAFYRKQKYYIGISAKHLFYNTLTNNNRIIYGLVAYDIFINGHTSLIPSSLIRQSGDKTTFNIGLHIKLRKSILIGAQIKSAQQFNIQGALALDKLITRINNYLLIGYSFDYGFSNLYSESGNSHEIILKYNLKKRPNSNAILQHRTTISPLFF